MPKLDYNLDRTARDLGGYEDALPIIPRELKLSGRRVEALARESAARSVASSAKPRRRPRSVGHHATVHRPRRFYI